MIIETSGWRHLKEKKISFLAMNIKKCILQAQKLPNFLKLSGIKNRKLYFSPMFQKAVLRNSTFFQEGRRVENSKKQRIVTLKKH